MFQRRERRERDVRRLREMISEKKTSITTVTKGIPFNKIEVRPNDQLPTHTCPTVPSPTKQQQIPHKTSISLPPPPTGVHIHPKPSLAAGALTFEAQFMTGIGSLPHIQSGINNNLYMQLAEDDHEESNKIPNGNLAKANGQPQKKALGNGRIHSLQTST